MKFIVSDSTILITLLNIERMDILTKVFDTVYIPSKVYEEVVIDEHSSLDSAFFKKQEINDRMLYKLLTKSLDAGESEAIVLAQELVLPLMIDEKKGRKIASNMGISIIGFLGVLLLNYKKGFFSSEEIEAIFHQAKEADFRVSQRLEEQFLALLKGEHDSK